MNIRTIIKNLKTYREYCEFRKNLFYEISPKNAEAILYLIPWLLCINHKNCPGYIQDLNRSIRLFNIDRDKEIKKRIKQFYKMFDLPDEKSLLSFDSNCCWIEGFFTIGSVGTISQTSHSDCDMWVVIDREKYDDKTFNQLHEKVTKIRDWINENYTIEVYFFINELENIRRCYFGVADGGESGGSATKGVLKEEFYRTSIFICGKIPFWWICFDPDYKLNYNEVYKASMKNQELKYEIVDFGNLEKIDHDEFFGAALWQFNKSLTKPLKSILKMILLKRMIEAPPQELICHQFREKVLRAMDYNFPDPSIFTVSSIFQFYKRKNPNTLEFLKVCFYLRCEMNVNPRKYPIKNKIIQQFLKKYKIDFEKRSSLDNFISWDFYKQIEIGSKIYLLLVDIYKDIVKLKSGLNGSLDKKDLTVLGKKIVSCMQKKNNKVQILQKPGYYLNIANPTFMMIGKIWKVFVSNDKTKILISDESIVKCIAYIVWNNLFIPDEVRMLPNSANITISEIIKIGKKIEDFFGIYKIDDVNFESFVKPEFITKILIIINFQAQDPSQKNNKISIDHFVVVYENNILELFIDKFDNPHKLVTFVKDAESKFNTTKIKINYYLQNSIPDHLKRKVISILSKAINDN